MIKHRRVDFDIIGSAGINSAKDDPMGDNNNTTTTRLSLGWGLGIDYWVTHHWQLSMTASNPFVDSTRVEMETGATTPNTAHTITTLGLVFNPTIALMIHLYN